MTRPRSKRCSSISFSTPIARRRRRSPSISTPPTTRCIGHQEGRFFHGYYDNYCYLPLYVFCGRHLLAAKLRPADIDASAGSVEEMARIVAHIRQRWPGVRILLRADSGFARDALMAGARTTGWTSCSAWPRMPG